MSDPDMLLSACRLSAAALPLINQLGISPNLACEQFKQLLPLVTTAIGKAAKTKHVSYRNADDHPPTESLREAIEAAIATLPAVLTPHHTPEYAASLISQLLSGLCTAIDPHKTSQDDAEDPWVDDGHWRR